jgi:hypothetical protein
MLYVWRVMLVLRLPSEQLSGPYRTPSQGWGIAGAGSDPPHDDEASYFKMKKEGLVQTI